jgi:hypothetical protein
VSVSPQQLGALSQHSAGNLSSEFIFIVLYPHSTISKSSPVDRDLSRSPNLSFKMKLDLKVVQQAQCT